MPIDVSDLRATIVPKSDQLNAEQLLGGPMLLTITDVRVGAGEDQPVVVHYQGDNGRPYKPCKTMRKVLILAWGQDGREWVGKSLEVYNDPAVRFGNMDVGGIRIARMSDIPKDIKVSLTATKGKKALHEIKLLKVPAKAAASKQPAETPEAAAARIAAGDMAEGAAHLSTLPQDQLERIWQHIPEATQEALSAAWPA